MNILNISGTLLYISTKKAFVHFLFLLIITLIIQSTQKVYSLNNFREDSARSSQDGNFIAENTWEYVSSVDNSSPDARHECSYIESEGKFYLIGGRGNPALNIYDPATNKWSSGNNIPGGKELHHFQAVTYNNKIYIMGAFTGGFPSETPVADIYIYDPANNSWTILANQIPSSRRRGAAGVVVYNNKIYLIGGIKNGHTDGWVNWMDEFDPQTLTWKILPDAPHQRDHFQAVVMNNKIYIAGGRKSSYPNTINLTEASVDVYSFSSQTWSTLSSSSDIPTPRAGTATVVLNNELVVVAGESGNNGNHHEVEAFNPATNSWRTLPVTLQGRNGPGGISFNGSIFLVAGTVNGNEVNTQEIYSSSVNQTPVILNPLPDMKVNINAATSQKSLITVFADDEGTANLIYSVSGNSNPSLVTASISNSTMLLLSYTAEKTGLSLIKIRATDNSGNFTEDEFRIDVIDLPVAGSFSRFINCGGNTVVFNGQSWMADQSFSNGSAYSDAQAISGTTNDEVYQYERFGKNFAYSIPVPSGIYNIRLHFAEIYWNSAGKRIFNVNLENGKGSLANIDIFAEAGKNTILYKEFTGIAVTDGILNIDFSTLNDNAKISGIEITGATSLSCGIPLSPAAGNITSKTATVKWDVVAGAQNYQIEYKKSSESLWTIASSTNTGNTISFSNLSAKTVYNWRVKATCASGTGTYRTSQFTTIIPVANAGSDKNLTLPVSNTTLNGSGTITNGTITGYSWVQISGPNTAIFSSKTVAAPLLSGLTEGIYSFNLTVMDNNAVTSASDQVRVTVTKAIAGNLVTSFTLVNADNNTDIGIIKNGSSINLSQLSTQNLNIRGNTISTGISKVMFVLSGQQSRSISESASPYALFGDNKGDYESWTPQAGSYTLNATPYSTIGVAGVTTTINFTVISSTANRTINLNESIPSREALTGIGTGDVENTGLHVEVWPNPAVTSFNIKTTSALKSPFYLTVADYQGRIIESRTGVFPGANILLGSAYPKGMYYIRIVQNDQTEIKKVIKL